MSMEYTEEKLLEYTEQILAEKSKGNEFFKKNQNEEAREAYQNAINIGDNIFKSIPSEEKLKFKTNTYFEKFKSELKNCYSNLSAVYLRLNNHKEIIQLDEYIISNLDADFDKSYARIIMAYHALGDNDKSTNYYMSMSRKFNKETMKKYEEQLNPIQIIAKEKLEEMKKKYEKKNDLFNPGYKKYFIKMLLIAVAMIFYLFSRGYFKKFWGGESSELSLDETLKSHEINQMGKSNSDESINLENLSDEDLNLEGESHVISGNEGIDDKNSL